MTDLAFPSEEFPAQPAITLHIPDDWTPVHSPGAVMAARRAAENGTFAPNVVVRIERRPADFEITDALTELKQFADERPEGTISEPFKAELDGQTFVGCDLSWVDDQVGTVLQAHLFGGVPSGPFPSTGSSHRVRRGRESARGLPHGQDDHEEPHGRDARDRRQPSVSSWQRALTAGVYERRSRSPVASRNDRGHGVAGRRRHRER